MDAEQQVLPRYRLYYPSTVLRYFTFSPSVLKIKHLITKYTHFIITIYEILHERNVHRYVDVGTSYTCTRKNIFSTAKIRQSTRYYTNIHGYTHTHVSYFVICIKISSCNCTVIKKINK